MTFSPSLYQQAIFDFVRNGRGSAIVRAVAGSGKTKTIERCLPLIPEERHVQLFAFNTTIAKELNSRLDGLRQEFNRPFAHVRASTFHRVGFGVIRKHLAGRVDVQGDKLRRIIRDWLTETDNEMYGSFITHLVSLARGEGVGVLVPDTDDAWWNLIAHHDLYLESANALEEHAIKLARDLLSRSNAAAKGGLIDFDDQLYLPLLWRLRLWQNDWVFVDEAQDTNPVRRAIAKLALRPGGRLVAVGDPKQAIYGFTGASHDALDLIAHEFNCQELPLTVSYRCGKSIVAKAQEIVPYLEAHSDNDSGKVEDLPFATALPLLTSHDAVLCRQTAPLVELAYTLIGRGIGCAILGREIGDGLVALIEKMKARGLESLEKKLEAFAAREIAKFTAKGEEGKAEAVADRVACIHAIMRNLAETERTIPSLIARIKAMFSDTNGVLTLCTVHKAKGKEWGRVAILRPELMPSKWARQDWQMTQEENLMYVAYTRARSHLIFIQPGE